LCILLNILEIKMIKYYCDICGDEITETNKPPSKFIAELESKVVILGIISKEKLVVQLIQNDQRGDIDACVCKYCMIDAINTMDDRTRDICGSC